MKERPIIFSAPIVLANRREVDPKTQTRRTRGLDRINEEPDAWRCEGLAPDGISWHFESDIKTAPDGYPDLRIRCPYGVAGDQLWCREAWKPCRWDEGEPWRFEYADGGKMEETKHSADSADYEHWSETLASRIQAELDALIAAGKEDVSFDGDRYSWTGDNPLKWRSSIHMPRWASRDTLEVVSVRPERLQSITEADAIAEGIMQQATPDLKRNLLHWGDPSFDRCATASGAYTALWDSINGPGSWASNPYVWRIEYRRLTVQG